MANLNIECENIYNKWDVDINYVVENAKKFFNIYMSCPEILEYSCLKDYEYDTISFDILLCESKKTHQINRDYRGKDYPADIITFAVFADSEEGERFILDNEINLGEIIISLEKMIEGANEKSIPKEEELLFFISHGILHLLGFDHQNQEEFEFVVEHQKKALESVDIHYDKI